MGLFGSVGGAIDGLFGGGGGGGPNLSEDPRLRAIRKKLYGEAKDFRKGLPELQGRARINLLGDARGALTQGISNTRKNFNRRGLLYSGLRQGGEQGLRGQVASSLASSIAGSNQDLENEAKGREMSASSVGLQGFGDAISRNNQLFDIRNQNAMERRKALASLGQGVGYMAGSYYGNRTPESEAIQRRSIGGGRYMSNDY